MNLQENPILDKSVVEFIWSMNSPGDDFAADLYQFL